MSTRDKYELLTDPQELPLFLGGKSATSGELYPASTCVVSARHTRLKRDARVYVFPRSSVDSTRFTQIVSGLSKLDHPLIPHLIDLVEVSDDFHLVTEFLSDERVTPDRMAGADKSQDPLAALQFWEQVATALRHASQFGVAHGALDDACFRRGESLAENSSSGGLSGRAADVKLAGLGLRQIGDDSTSLDDLLKEDLACLKRFVARSLDGIAVSEDSSKPSGDVSDEAKSIHRFRLRLAEQDDSIERFSADFGDWLHRELSFREARKLAVSDRGDIEQVSKKSPWPWVVTVAVSVLLLALGCATWYWSQGGDDATVARASGGVADRESADGNDDDSDSSAVPSPVTSSLQDVGALNNLASETPDEMEPSNDLRGANDSREEESEVSEESDVEIAKVERDSERDTSLPTLEPESNRADENHEEPGLTDVASGAEEVSANDEMGQVSGEGSDSDGEQMPQERTKSPFVELASSIDLPTHTSTKAKRLLTTDLTDDEGLNLSLVTATGVRIPAFSLQSGRNGNRWQLIASYRDETTPIAELARQAGKLFFRWLPAAATYPNVNHARNAFLVLTSGKWTADVALRSPLKKQGVVFDLERSRPHDLGIVAPPGGMFLEFLASDKSLVVASPTKIPWKDGVMSLGLDSGQKSLFVLRLSPQSKSKILAQTIARPKGKPRFTIKKGFGRDLNSKLSNVNVSLFQMRQAVNQIRGENSDERKKRVRAMISRLEKEKAEGETYMEAYMAARETRVNLRVGCEIEGRTLVLAEFRDPLTED